MGACGSLGEPPEVGLERRWTGLSGAVKRSGRPRRMSARYQARHAGRGPREGGAAVCPHWAHSLVMGRTELGNYDAGDQLGHD